MEIGDLVKWRHPNEPELGLVAGIRPLMAKVMWSDGACKWHTLIDLEVIHESR